MDRYAQSASVGRLWAADRENIGVESRRVTACLSGLTMLLVASLACVPACAAMPETDVAASAGCATDRAADAGRPIRLGFPNDRAPLSSGSARRPGGVLPLLLASLPPASFKVHALTSDELRRRIAQDELDAVIGVPDRDLPAHWLRSGGYLRIPNVIVTRRQGISALEANDLQGRHIAVIDDLPQGWSPPGVHVQRSTDARQALVLLLSGQVDGVVGNALVIEHARRVTRAVGLVVGAPAGFDDVLVLAAQPRCARWVMAFDRQWPASAPAIERAARTPVPSLRIDAERMKRPLALLGLALAVLGIGLVYANGYWKLRRESRRRSRLRRRIDEISDNLPVVVFHARRQRDARICMDLVVGDVPQLFSASAGELQADPSRALAALHGRERRRVVATLERGARRIQPVSFRFSAHGVRGMRCIAMHAWPTLQQDGEQHWAGYWLDVSDARMREHGIERAHARAAADAGDRNRLAAALGSGMDEPIHALQQRLAVLGDGPLDGQQRAALASLQDASTMLSRILDDVRALSAGDAAEMMLHPTPVDLRQLLIGVETLLRPVALSKGLVFHQQVDSEVADWLEVDGTRLRQILFNLVGNAIKFTAQGEVRLRVQWMGDIGASQRVRVEVADSGVGIAPERQESVFEPFAQAALSTTRLYGGTGLGLGICRQLAQQMGGSLQLHSVPGQGTVVAVELVLPRSGPLPSDTPAPRTGQAGSVAQPAISHRVLVAEDDPTQQVLMQWWLRGMELDVEVVGDGVAAFERWQVTRPALLFTDERMPGLDGHGLVRQVRLQEAQRGLPPTPIIGMSADTDGLRDLPVDYLLAKPISRATLQSAIATVAPALLVVPGVVEAAAARARADVPTLSVLAGRFGSEEVARALAQTLRSSLEEDLLALQREWQQESMQAAAQRLHRMAGGVGSVGMTKLSAELRELSESDAPIEQAQRMAVAIHLRACIAQLQRLSS